jgi:hypothetical protein
MILMCFIFRHLTPQVEAQVCSVQQ